MLLLRLQWRPKHLLRTNLLLLLLLHEGMWRLLQLLREYLLLMRLLQELVLLLLLLQVALRGTLLLLLLLLHELLRRHVEKWMVLGVLMLLLHLQRLRDPMRRRLLDFCCDGLGLRLDLVEQKRILVAHLALI